jgi:oligoendopeptidase F
MSEESNMSKQLYERLMRLMWCVLAVAALALILPSVAPAQTQAVRQRSEIPQKYTWNLADMYPSDEAFEADVKFVTDKIPELRSYQGKISKSPDDLLKFYQLEEEISKKLNNCDAFAELSYDQDTRDQKYAGYKGRIAILGAQFGEAVSWFTPELVTVPADTFEAWYRIRPALAVYRHSIDEVLRTKAHTLSPEEERIMALASNVERAPVNARTALCNADIKFPTVKDENGNVVELSEGRAYKLAESPDQKVRRNASMGLLNTYIQYQNTSAALMDGNVAGDIFNVRARNYQSSLHAALDADNIDTTVYLNLLATVKKNVGTLQRYVALRKRALGLDTIHLYDMMTPLIPETRVTVHYDDAVATIEAAMAPLGNDYLTTMKGGFNGRWVDVYESKGKRAGAYSMLTYLVHPYMLLNYNDTQEDMFTVAHEMGHSINTWYSNHTQPFVYSQYSYFNAEVASTFNEAMLMDYLLKKEKDPKRRLALVNQYIDNIRGTVITQVMFADFELRMHRAAEAGMPLTSENLCAMYDSTLHDFYGDAVTYDPEYAYTWIRIPHFYRDFYVYKYATSFCASQALSQAVLKKEKGAKERYIAFLSAGSSDYPLNILKRAGVDMTTPAPVEATMKKFSELVDELERLLKQTKRI